MQKEKVEKMKAEGREEIEIRKMNEVINVFKVYDFFYFVFEERVLFLFNLRFDSSLQCDLDRSELLVELSECSFILPI